MTVLDDLWYGNIAPSEQFLRDNTHFKKLVPVMADDREKLSENLTAEQNECLEKYDDTFNEMHSLAEVEAFKFGFKLAATLLFETI